LEFESLLVDRDDPRVAGSTTIRWIASARGGAGGFHYEFRTRRGRSEVVEQKGPSRTWDWSPEDSGAFRVKVIVTDCTGAGVDSGWSPAYVVIPHLSKDTLLAALPVENLSGGEAPLILLARSLRMNLTERGFRLLDDEVLEGFMKRHRVRYTGGVSSRVSRAMKEETEAEAILVTSVEAYEDKGSPEIALISRLVSSGENPEIVCTESVGLSGEGSVGLLGLGRVQDPQILLEKAVDSLGHALASCASAAGRRIRVLRVLGDTVDREGDGRPDGCDPCRPDEPDGSDGEGLCKRAHPCPSRFHGCSAASDVMSLYPEERGKRRYLPRLFFRSPILDPARTYTVAVIPFLNQSERENAGRIMTLHFVNRLLRDPMFAVTEPGLVRDQLLKYRIIMQSGPSLADTDIIASQGSLDVDLILSGTVLDYQDVAGVPNVDFSVKIIERKSREVVWASRSYNAGDEGVFFFDLGRVHTAHGLAVEMARGTLELLSR
jgi:TolB-like protein